MTNGEKIMQAFPDLQIDMGELEVYMWTTTHDAIDIPLDWWNEEYKEPTTKNCRSCRNFGTHHGICEICKDNKCWTEKEPTIKNDVPENNVGNIYICSCGYGWDKSKVVRHHFCPNCGKAVASATKNDLGVDAVSRKDVHDMLENLPITVGDKWFNWLQKACIRLAELPPLTPQEAQSFEWCTDCKEYDQEKHCCHRYSKVIRDTVAEIRQEPKIKVLDRDEAARKLGTVDIYKASAWVTLLKDLEYLGMKICEVDNGNNNH